MEDIVKKIDKYIQWDYGFSPIELYNKIKNNKIVIITIKILTILFIVIYGCGLAGVLSLLFFAYPICAFVLLTFYFIIAVWVYGIYSNRIQIGDIKKYLLKMIKK